jgi:hypothetical protein
MAVFTRIPLSGSSFGRNISITAVASPGTILHTVSTATSVIDNVYLFHMDTLTTATKDFTLELGATATTDQLLMTLAGKVKPNCIMDGLSYQGGATLIVRGFNATATFGVFIGGYVDRYTV